MPLVRWATPSEFTADSVVVVTDRATDTPTLIIVLAAICDTGASHADRKRLTTIIPKRASDAARQILEAMMKTDEWKDDFIESYVPAGPSSAVG